MLVSLVLWLFKLRLINFLTDWRTRALTAEIAHMHEGTSVSLITLRDVLPGPAYPMDGPWNDKELRAMLVRQLCAAHRASSATRQPSILAGLRSLSRSPRPACLECSRSRWHLDPPVPEPKSDAPQGGC